MDMLLILNIKNAVQGLAETIALARDQAFVNAMRKFGYQQVLRGRDAYSRRLTNAANGGTLHNSHLHCGNKIGNVSADITLKDGIETL